jgi:threonine/homoserine/homoserine lactone efflux protein
MLSWSQLGGFVLASVVLLVIPGPSVLFVVTRGVALGRRAALATVAGNEVGALVHVVAVSEGVGAIVQRSVAVFTVMKIVGAVYLVVLGARAMLHRGDLFGAIGAPTGPRSAVTLGRDGFLVGVSNPKTTLFFLAVLPQFADPARGHVSLQLLVLGLVFVGLAFVNDGLYGLAAGQVRRWLERSPRRMSRVGGASGLVMIGLGVRLVFTGRKD